MKKIIYSLMTMGLLMTGCADFDDPVTEKYGDAPSVAIEVTETTDSTFTFTVTPSVGTMFYSVLVDEADAPVALNAESLYKGLYSSTYGTIVVDAKEQATFTYNMRNAEGAPIASPNTTYQIYAVAANEKSVIGEIAVESVTTTDALAPKPVDYEYDPDNGVMYVAFSEAITRVEDVAVTAKYYKIMELYNGVVAPVDVDADSIVVEVQDNQIAILAKSAPAGAYVSFSWEEGAFVDSYGHKCAAITSGFSESEGDFVGLSGQNTNVPFAISEENVTAPELGSVIENWQGFMGVISFDFDVYHINPMKVATNAIKVTYTNNVTTKTITLSENQWAILEGKDICFVLPEEPVAGDSISFSIAADVVCDVYGNPNTEFTSVGLWKMFDFTATEEMVFNTFNGVGISSYDNQAYSIGENISISAFPSYDAEVPTGKACIIKNLLLDGSTVLGCYDLESATVYVGAGYAVGNVTIGGTEYGSITYSLSGADWIAFTINSDGTLTSTDLGYVATDTEYTQAVGWLDKYSTATLTPVVVESTSVSPKGFNTVKKVNVQSSKSLKALKK